MIPRHKISLRFILPFMLCFVFFLLQGGYYFLEFTASQNNLYKERIENLNNAASSLRENLTNAHISSQSGEAQELLSILSLNSNFKNIAIIDENKKVILSNFFEEKGQPASQVIKKYKQEKFELSLKTNHFVQEELTDSQEVILYAPLNILSNDNYFSREFNGAIYIRYSLVNEINQIKKELIFSFLKVIVALLITLFLLIYIINRMLIRPVNKLAEATKISDLGNQIEVDKSGFGEIGVLQREFDRLTNEVKKNITQLSENEERWVYALTAAQDGVWDWNIADDNVYYSDDWAKQLGLDYESLSSDISEWDTRIHPDDYLKVHQDLEFHFSGRSDFFNNTHRIKCKNNEYRWILSRGKTVSWDLKGVPMRMVGTNTDVTEYKKIQEELKKQAQFDEVTRLPNRIRLLSYLKRELVRAEKNQSYGAIVFLECNEYDTINDLEGYEKADQFLLALASRLKEVIPEELFLAHLSRGEFIFVFNDLDKIKEIAAIRLFAYVKKIDKDFKSEFEFLGKEVSLTSSIGITLYCNKEISSNDLLRQSALALKLGKENSSTNIRFFEDQVEKKLNAHHKIQKQMGNALKENEFTLFFQPRKNNDGELVGAEVLARWINKEEGWIKPVEFIKVAENSGLIVPLSKWVIKNAIKQLAQWELAGLPVTFTKLSINVSHLQFLQDGFVNSVEDALRENKVTPRFIEIEIAETLFLTEIELIIEKMDQLRKLGVCFAIDNFGKGCTSFAYLCKLPISTIIIDQSLTQGLIENEANKVIISNIFNIATHLSLNLIAEGIETKEQYQLLKEYGCSQYQGYFINVPLAKKEFELLLLKNKKLDVV